VTRVSSRPLTRLARAILIVASVLTFAVPSAHSASPYSGKGFDVSYPQCTGYATITGAFAIIGINGGRPFTDNTCRGSEYDYAKARNLPVSFYMNLKAPIGKTATAYTSGPRQCGNDRRCQAHNYGWNAANYAYGKAPTQVATWWLDIETANSWSGQADINVATIQGAVDYFLQQPSLGVQAVGIYSTASMWKSITGGYRDAAWPVWVPGSGSASCGTGFTGGPVWLVQTKSGASEGDLAC
jgi:hypothetical protein